MKKELFQKEFSDKRVTKMGLGPNGRSFGDIVFLLRHGAHVLVTDHRDAPDIHVSKDRLLEELTDEEKGRISFVLGEHRREDFIECDYVLKASGVPLDSEYLLATQGAGIPVHTSSAWLFQIATQTLNVTTIGVTGTKGKSTTTDMVEHILEKNSIPYHVAGNIRGVANLPVLDSIEEGDVIIAELDSWQLQGFGDSNISPNISIFTNFFEDHLNYYGGSMELYFKDKSYIYKNQKDIDICLVSKQAYEQITFYEGSVPEQVEDISTSLLPDDLELHTLGEHNRENAALAYAAASQIGLTKDQIATALASYKPMEGRLRKVGEHEGISYYDDNNSTTPTSTQKSLEAIKVSHPDSRVLWFGGGADKEFDYANFGQALPGLVHEGILFAGAATEKICTALGDSELKNKLQVVNSMEEAWQHVDAIKKENDVIVLSPGAASFGVFLNEYERGDQYNDHIQKLLNK